ncbi:MAG: hypothetical protein GX663_11010 [Clostridiales bacterium]|nr:hypothetical protein [Clostridiales bacterium]
MKHQKSKMFINQKLKEKFNEEMVGAENEPALPGKLQWKKEMADMFEDMTNPKKIQERKLKEKRRSFIKNKTKKFGL